MSRESWRELAAEFLGTFVLIIFGVAVVAQVVLGSKYTPNFGEALSINIGWGLAVVMGVYVAGGVTGAHLNPAVTLALAVSRGFAWGKVVPYWIAQVAGAFAASAVVYAVYHEALASWPRDMSTAGIWATYPNGNYVLSNVPGGLVDQIVGTALLVGCIFAISDKRNLAPQGNLAPLVVGAAVLLIGMTFGMNCGYAINPARDFGPRLFTYFAGWGSQVFTAHDNWWWVPIVGPLIGGVAGGVIYDLFITRYHPSQDAP